MYNSAHIVFTGSVSAHEGGGASVDVRGAKEGVKIMTIFFISPELFSTEEKNLRVFLKTDRAAPRHPAIPEDDTLYCRS